MAAQLFPEKDVLDPLARERPPKFFGVELWAVLRIRLRTHVNQDVNPVGFQKRDEVVNWMIRMSTEKTRNCDSRPCSPTLDLPFSKSPLSSTVCSVDRNDFHT